MRQAPVALAVASSDVCFGMPIAQMRTYSQLARRGQATLAERLSLLTGHEAQVQERITVLQAQHQHRREKIDWYRRQLPRRAPDAFASGPRNPPGRAGDRAKRLIGVPSVQVCASHVLIGTEPMRTQIGGSCASCSS